MTARVMIPPADLATCREMIRTGSLSFHSASRALPARVRDPALALYAFCRVADDEVDEGTDKVSAVLRLRDRLDLIYQGRPREAAPDRAFAAVVAGFDMPRALPEALLEGLAWDSLDRRYANLSELKDYSARVAASVGAMMCVLMRVRDADALARACDLGLAMQLTNIARDVGEDARAGRLFLPLDWMAAEGVCPDAFLSNPTPSPQVRAMTARLLTKAGELYSRAATGVCRLPVDCRLAIHMAGHVYSAIGTEVARAGHDSITRRARTTARQKLGWLTVSALQTAFLAVVPQSARLHAPPEPEVAFLVQSAARARPGPARSEALLRVLAQLEARDRGMI